MRKIKICVAVTLIAVIAIGIYTTMVSAVNVSWDFEDGKLPSWTAIYDNANMSIESEDNGNKYLKLSTQCRKRREYNRYIHQ